MKLKQFRLSAMLVTGLAVLIYANSAFANVELQPMKNKADDLLSASQIGPALDIYHEIIAKDPEFANCYYNMAICYNQLKQFDKAYASLEKFVKLSPKDSEAYFNMGIMQVYLGDDEKARTLLLKARALKPNKNIKRRIQDALDHLQPSMFPEESLAQIKALYERS